MSDEEERVIIQKDGTKKKRSDAWKKKNKARVRVEHKTYEEILAEEAAPQVHLPEKIIDATGAEIREVTSLSDLATASWTPSTDPMRIPEVRHNLRLLCESCQTDLSGLAQEGKILVDRKSWIEKEEGKLRRRVAEEAQCMFSISTCLR